MMHIPERTTETMKLSYETSYHKHPYSIHVNEQLDDSILGLHKLSHFPQLKSDTQYHPILDHFDEIFVSVVHVGYTFGHHNNYE